MWQTQWQFFNEGSTNPLTWTELEKISFEGRKNIQCLDITSYQKTHISWHQTFFFTQFECYDYMDIKIITDVVEYMENIGNLMYPPYFYGLVAYEHQNESSPNFFPRKLNTYGTTWHADKLFYGSSSAWKTKNNKLFKFTCILNYRYIFVRIPIESPSPALSDGVVYLLIYWEAHTVDSSNVGHAGNVGQQKI